MKVGALQAVSGRHSAQSVFHFSSNQVPCQRRWLDEKWNTVDTSVLSAELGLDFVQTVFHFSSNQVPCPRRWLDEKWNTVLHLLRSWVGHCAQTVFHFSSNQIPCQRCWLDEKRNTVLHSARSWGQTLCANRVPCVICRSPSPETLVR